MMSLTIGSCDLEDLLDEKIDGDDACEQTIETLYDVIQDCLRAEGYHFPEPPSAIARDYCSSECDDDIEDEEVSESKVDECKEELEDLDCEDVIDMDALRNYGEVIAREGAEPSECDYMEDDLDCD